MFVDAGWVGGLLSKGATSASPMSHVLLLSSWPEWEGSCSVKPSSGNGTLQRQESMTGERQSLTLHANGSVHLIPVNWQLRLERTVSAPEK